MQVSLDLDVTKEEFFEFINDSLLQDIKTSTNREVSKEDIKKGYTYEKELKNKLGRAGDVEVNILEFEPCKEYIAEFKSNQGTNRISYNIKNLNDEKINVTYSESYIASDKLKDWNFKLMNLFYKKKSISRAESILKNIERYIKNKKGDM
ncbi:DUF3284 domain-containing protein [Clostridium sp. D2Q-14]|uniref:DUF3284 domain-containing protein n=1 Tax=Anaeromonas gelatinilytica TaxID=2683194 RepID=UPI00193C128C|nr:DUF3284 domain-containing protein [Anaeromonas gelatinilytica]MBS4535457.1 DUF3284 domain-containing protein [Anaeromonas gelatinilytica]